MYRQLINNSSYADRWEDSTINIVHHLNCREHLNGNRMSQRCLYSSPVCVDKLGQESVLRGHEGCVNCLEWSTDGRILASGSDDLNVILWDAFRAKRLQTIRTKHLGNMFSVKFLPHHNDAMLATCAADRFIYVFDINHPNDIVLSCNCHKQRVKRLATAPDNPFVFWSAGEDGSILQLDIREQHTCRSEESRVRIINLTQYMDNGSEAKCLAINPRRTEMLAVGANDPYVRLYDKRMLHATSACDTETRVSSSANDCLSLPKDCVTYFCPGHISKDNSRLCEPQSRAVTYLTFNANGTEILVNMGAEHIYLYDLQSAKQPIFMNLPKFEMSLSGENEDSNALGETGSVASGSRKKLPDIIEQLKKTGNYSLENEKYLKAIEVYSEAIALSPDTSVLYLNRATAYMRRQWYGDVYAALRDCHQALRLDPSYIKAHFRLARALLELGLSQEADDCLKELINRFPNYANNHGVMMLNKDIKDNRQTNTSNQQAVEVFNYMELSEDEFMWRSKARDYCKRFLGHCNTTTDIKEANYLGHDGKYIVAGSDDGNFFIWDRDTGKIRAIYKGDSAIVNCVQPHPNFCFMATSGIDHDIKIWAPISEESGKESKLQPATKMAKCVEDNQQKLKSDPFDLSTRTAYCFTG